MVQLRSIADQRIVKLTLDRHKLGVKLRYSVQVLRQQRLLTRHSGSALAVASPLPRGPSVTAAGALLEDAQWAPKVCIPFACVSCLRFKSNAQRGGLMAFQQRTAATQEAVGLLRSNSSMPAKLTSASPVADTGVTRATIVRHQRAVAPVAPLTISLRQRSVPIASISLGSGEPGSCGLCVLDSARLFVCFFVLLLHSTR